MPSSTLVTIIRLCLTSGQLSVFSPQTSDIPPVGLNLLTRFYVSCNLNWSCHREERNCRYSRWPPFAHMHLLHDVAYIMIDVCQIYQSWENGLRGLWSLWVWTSEYWTLGNGLWSPLLELFFLLYGTKRLVSTTVDKAHLHKKNPFIRQQRSVLQWSTIKQH
jgi:hypothetical protein